VTPPLITVFGASKAAPGDGLYEQGVDCGRLLAEAGYAVATGGYGGLMEAVSRGARDAGGHVVGVTAPDVFPDRTGANSFVVEEWKAAHLMERIHDLTRVSAAAITLPGSLGTLTELVAAWNLGFVARFSGGSPKPLITVGDRWRTIVADLAELLETDLGLVTCVEDVAAAVAEVRRTVPRTA
jgi:uncharacterized protein (TIGR00730 family)